MSDPLSTSGANRFRMLLPRLGWVVFAATAYFAWFSGVVGLRPEHIGMFLMCAGAYLAHPSTRRALVAFAAFIVFWIVYDSMRVWPNYIINPPVHISEPYLFDKQWFGIDTPSGRQTLNEFWATRTTPFLDVLTAAFYLSWVPLPMAFAVWLWWNNKPLFIRFSYAYMLTNLIGFALYYVYPAAPPWYVELNGFEFVPNTARSAAGLDNFDRMFGIKLFQTIYQRNSNVFAAIPSLHSAYPLVTLFYARQVQQKWPTILFATLCIGIWLSAIYLRHHYVVDVALGILTAVAGYVVFETLIQRPFLSRWFERLLRYV